VSTQILLILKETDDISDPYLALKESVTLSVFS